MGVELQSPVRNTMSLDVTPVNAFCHQVSTLSPAGLGFDTEYIGKYSIQVYGIRIYSRSHNSRKEGDL